jgi:hypothetical protein
MIRVHVVNGWKDAPDCWMHFWKFNFENNASYFSFNLLGFVFFFYRT